MRSFLKVFFASLLALIIFTIIGVMVLIGIGVSAASSEAPSIAEKGVLVLDASLPLPEQGQENPLSAFTPDATDVVGLHDVIALINYAKTDDNIKGIYIRNCYSPNGLATLEELRTALADFKKSKKFIYAYSDIMNQKGYYLSSVADKVFAQPEGFFEWGGLSSEITYFKQALDRLNIQPQIFYAGKFKSATEPFRADKMSPENRLQTSVFINELYGKMLIDIAADRKIDTATLRNLANTAAIRTVRDAVDAKLLDGAKYDDDVKTLLANKVGIKPSETINFVSISKYHKAVTIPNDGTDKIAIIVANGDIMDGEQEGNGVVTSNVFKNLVRKARLDDKVKAIVLRVNSPGGSALASDVIWHEITLAKKEKPVVVSMGDVAASGGYYIACAADSVFANHTTITGSIGVFTILPNMQGFLKDKLGVTFDGVKTGPYADMLTITRPLTPAEQALMQTGVEKTYGTFKKKVADGRKKSVDYIDSIAQGRVWTGDKGVTVGLVDRIGTLQDAVASAARMAKSKSYKVRFYPEAPDFLQQVLNGNAVNNIKTQVLKSEIGEAQWQLLNKTKQVQNLVGVTQCRMPFDISVR
jgi:protease IV